MLAGKAGAIDAVIAAMRAHVGNAGVSKQAFSAMQTLCSNGAPSCLRERAMNVQAKNPFKSIVLMII